VLILRKNCTVKIKINLYLDSDSRSESQVSVRTNNALRPEAPEDRGRFQVNHDPVCTRLGAGAAPSSGAVKAHRFLFKPTFSTRHHDGLVGDATSAETKVSHRSALKAGSETTTALAVEGAGRVDALGRCQITARAGALVHI